jgi:putative flippase GtrA
MTPERRRLVISLAAGVGLILLVIALPALQQAAPDAVVYLLAVVVVALLGFWFLMRVIYRRRK